MTWRLRLFAGSVLAGVLLASASMFPGAVETKDYPDCYILGSGVPVHVLVSYGCHP